MPTIDFVRPLAIKAAQFIDDAYEAEVKDWYENGDGRPSSEGGRGYTFPHCRHGASRWTDYDNICGGCEDGLTTEQIGEAWASEAADTIDKRQAWMSYAPSDLPTDQRVALVEWTFEPLTRLTKIIEEA